MGEINNVTAVTHSAILRRLFADLTEVFKDKVTERTLIVMINNGSISVSVLGALPYTCQIANIEDIGVSFKCTYGYTDLINLFDSDESVELHFTARSFIIITEKSRATLASTAAIARPFKNIVGTNRELSARYLKFVLGRFIATNALYTSFHQYSTIYCTLEDTYQQYSHVVIRFDTVGLETKLSVQQAKLLVSLLGNTDTVSVSESDKSIQILLDDRRSIVIPRIVVKPLDVEKYTAGMKELAMMPSDISAIFKNLVSVIGKDNAELVFDDGRISVLYIGSQVSIEKQIVSSGSGLLKVTFNFPEFSSVLHCIRGSEVKVYWSKDRLILQTENAISIICVLT